LRHFDELEKKGYTVVEDVLSAAQVTKFRDGLMAVIKAMTGDQVDASNPDTFEKWPRDFALGNGMILQGGGIGSTSILHDLREVLRYVFAELHGCDPDDLRCNPDGVACYLPAGLVKAKRLRDTSGKPIPKRMAGEEGKTWAHVDGGFGGQVLPGRMGVTVQGQVPLVAQAEEGATLVVVEGSHLKGAEFRRKHNLQGPEILSREQLEALVAMGGCTVRRVCAPAGALVLWRSDLYHWGTLPTHDFLARAATGEGGLTWRDAVRCTAYVCMAPALPDVDDAMCKRRLGMMLSAASKDQGVTLSHDPVFGFRKFPQKPYMFGRPCKDLKNVDNVVSAAVIQHGWSDALRQLYGGPKCLALVRSILEAEAQKKKRK
jgi:hypothetical protein